MVQTDRVGRLLALRWRKTVLEDQLKALPPESNERASLQRQIDDIAAEELYVLSRLTPQQRVQLGFV